MKPVEHKGRIVGHVHDGVFHKTLSGSRHFIKVPEPGIAFTPHTLHQARRLGAKVIEVLDRETGVRYRADIIAVHEGGASIERGGYEQQFCWPLSKWEKIEPATA